MKHRIYRYGLTIILLCLGDFTYAELTTVFYDNLNDYSNFQNAWTIIETGDFDMEWFKCIRGRVCVRNDGGGGNDQSVIFAHHVDTTGYQDIVFEMSYASYTHADYEESDFIRVLGYSKDGPLTASPIIEWTTENTWYSNSIHTELKVIQIDFGEYSYNNPDFWFAFEFNTSEPTECLNINYAWVRGESIPEPASLSMVSIGLLFFRKKSMVCKNPVDKVRNMSVR